MYKHHFALKHHPFERTLHADELFEGEAQGEARSRIRHLLDLRGIGLLTGEAGSGKTTVCRQAVSGLHAGLFRVHYVSLSTGSVLDTYNAIASEFGLPAFAGRAAAYRAIRAEASRMVAESKQLPVLIFDEAHHLRNEILEELRLLTNYRMDAEKRLCLLLVGPDRAAPQACHVRPSVPRAAHRGPLPPRRLQPRGSRSLHRTPVAPRRSHCADLRARRHRGRRPGQQWLPKAHRPHRALRAARRDRRQGAQRRHRPCGSRQRRAWSMRDRSTLRADALRGIPLQRVAAALGYHRDSRDPRTLDAPRAPSSASTAPGSTIISPHREAAAPSTSSCMPATAPSSRHSKPSPTSPRPAPNPPARHSGERLDPAYWPAVLDHLVRHRSLDHALLDAGFRQCILGADQRANAVFITRDAGSKPAGAELLGNQPGRPFRGMAPGSRKDSGGFWIARRTPPQSALIVESAVDALSAFELPSMQDTDLFLSTAGLASRLPPWIADFPLQDIACGYDADPPGDQAADRLIRTNTNLRRIRPIGEKDWNDILQSRKRDARLNRAPKLKHTEPDHAAQSADRT